MTVEEFHDMCTSEIEQYIDRKTNTRFTLDYSEHRIYDEWEIAWKTYQANLEKNVVCVRALVDKSGKAVLVAEYQ